MLPIPPRLLNTFQIFVVLAINWCFDQQTMRFFKRKHCSKCEHKFFTFNLVHYDSKYPTCKRCYYTPEQLEEHWRTNRWVYLFGSIIAIISFISPFV